MLCFNLLKLNSHFNQLMIFFFCQLRVRAYDSANPKAFSEEDVTINILRNVNRPSFGASSFSTRISEAMLIGTSVIQLTASDVDKVSYM